MWEREKSIQFWASESPWSPKALLAGGRLMAYIYKKIIHFTCNSTLIHSESTVLWALKICKAWSYILRRSKMPTAWNFYQVAFKRTTPIDCEQIQAPPVDFNWKSTRKQEIRFWVYKIIYLKHRNFVSLTKLHRSKEQAKPCKCICSKRITFRHFRNAKADV